MNKNCFEDENEILQVITSEFYRRFKKEPNVYIKMTVLLSRNISDEDNAFLTREEEIHQIVTHPLKVQGPDDIHVISVRNVGT